MNFSSINVPGVTMRATLRSKRRPPDLTLPDMFVGNSSLIATYLFRSCTSIFKNLSSWKNGNPARATGPALVFFQASFKLRRGAYFSACSKYSYKGSTKGVYQWGTGRSYFVEIPYPGDENAIAEFDHVIL